MGHGYIIATKSLLANSLHIFWIFKIFNQRFDLCKVFLQCWCWFLRDLELWVVILMMKVFQIGLFICTAVSWTDNCKSFKSITEEGQQSLAILGQKSRNKTRGQWFTLLASTTFSLQVFWHKECTLAVATSLHFGFKISMTNFICKFHWVFMYLSFVMSWLSNWFFF